MDVLIVPAFHQFYLAFNGFLKTPIDKILHHPPVMLKSKPSPSFFPYYFLHAMLHNISLLHFAAFCCILPCWCRDSFVQAALQYNVPCRPIFYTISMILQFSCATTQVEPLHSRPIVLGHLHDFATLYAPKRNTCLVIITIFFSTG